MTREPSILRLFWRYYIGRSTSRRWLRRYWRRSWLGDAVELTEWAIVAAITVVAFLVILALGMTLSLANNAADRPSRSGGR